MLYFICEQAKTTRTIEIQNLIGLFMNLAGKHFRAPRSPVFANRVDRRWIDLPPHTERALSFSLFVF